MSEIPAHLQPYLQVLGPHDAVEFLLAFGGSPVYLARQPTMRSEVAQLVGIEKAKGLAQEIGPGHVRVPLCKSWLALQLRGQGMSVTAIARKLRVDATNVRKWFASEGEQLSLF